MSTATALLAARKPTWFAVLRMRRLTSSRRRSKAASGVDRAIRSAERGNRRLSSSGPVARHNVLTCRTQLTDLSERLRSSDPVYSHGVFLAFELLSNAASPLYHPNGDLQLAIEDIDAALHGHFE